MDYRNLVTWRLTLGQEDVLLLGTCHAATLTLLPGFPFCRNAGRRFDLAESLRLAEGSSIIKSPESLGESGERQDLVALQEESSRLNESASRRREPRIAHSLRNILSFAASLRLLPPHWRARQGYVA